MRRSTYVANSIHVADGHVPGTVGAASARVGILGPDNREECVTADFDGRYAFTGVDLGKEYMLTFAPHFATNPPANPVVRNLTVTQADTRVDAQVPTN